MTTKPTDFDLSTEDFAMLEVAYLLVLVLVKLKSEEERAEHVWGGRRNDKRTSCSSRCLYVIIRIVFLPSHFFSVISVHDRRNDNNSAAIGGCIARGKCKSRYKLGCEDEPQYPGLASCAVRHCR